MKFLGVDTGGTFTDFILVHDGRVQTLKIPSTPADPSRALLQGLERLGSTSLSISHGSTVATNALLEGKGAPVLFMVTRGFRDILTLGRQNRPKLYALHPVRERRLLPDSQIIEVDERLNADGSIHRSLNADEVDRVVRQAVATGCTSVALCLLHSYANPAHEILLEDALFRKGFQVSRSSAILPEYREFERASTVLVNAMVSPVMSRYLDSLAAGLDASQLRIMQSNGGVMTASAAGQRAVHTVLSGPAGGMSGAFHMARNLGIQGVLTFDMGGTSTDVGLCDGAVPTTSETCIAGWPIKIPMIDIHTIGAGGGSIADLDAGGALRVGPASAGADPGPSCYGKGRDVTVTDANLFLGRLQPDNFRAAGLGLDVERSRQSMSDLARQAGLEPARLAEGIIEIVEEKMAAALRVVSVERGHDPRDFSLFPFGGAGGLHACALAEKLGMKRVCVPVYPGLLSAMGMLLALPMRDYSRSFLARDAGALQELDAAFQSMTGEARREMLAEGVGAAELRFESSLDVRYKGQSFEVNIPYGSAFLSAFHDEYARLYGHSHAHKEVEVVTLRLKALGSGLDFHNLDGRRSSGEGRSSGVSEVVWKGRTQSWPVTWREDLRADEEIRGPWLILEDSATLLLAPGWSARCHEAGHLLLERCHGV